MQTVKHLSLLSLILQAVFIMNFFKSTSSLTFLGRQSTANQVYKYLNDNDQLAPYVRGGTAIVTGGNSGIGAETVKTLCTAGMTVVLCARNMESAESVKKALPTNLQDRVEIQYMDLANLSSVKDAASAISSKFETIDCLVNNAGIMALKQRESTVDGFEKQWGTNHLGHHYLTRLLLPKISKTGRVVTVASTAHAMAKSPIDDWESKGKYTPWGAYGSSKLSNILFASQLQTNLKKENNQISSVSLHPGVIASPLWKHALPSLLKPVVSLIANKDTEQGAATTVYCALARTVKDGAYYDDCAVKKPSCAALDRENQKKLWEYTEKLLAEKGFSTPQKLVETDAPALV